MSFSFDILKQLLSKEKFDEALKYVESFKHFFDDDVINNLMSAIRKNDVNLALSFIESKDYNDNKPVTHENIDILGLQTTYQLLKTQLLVLTNQKIEAEKLITQFRIRYYQELGFIISKILSERLSLFEQIRDTNPDVNFEYEKAREQHNKFFNEWEHVPKEKESKINEELQKKIVVAYRKASKLCHPDLVEESVKEQATKIFVKINKAYIENDIQTIERVLEQLEKGLLEPEHVVQKSTKSLQAQIMQLNEEIHSLKKEMEEIKSSSTYSFISKLENWDIYFSETKNKLEKELEELKAYASTVTKTAN